jgi:hypothetical protein
MVLNQYRKYFYRGELPDGLDRSFLELIFVLHDIGKPQAVAQSRKSHQHEYTLPLLVSTFEKLGFPEEQINLAVEIVDGDPIGRFLKSKTPEEDIVRSAEEIVEASKRSGIGLEGYWKALQIYFMCDAGSYTEDAGGVKSLDSKFRFHPEQGRMEYSPETKAKVQMLEAKIFKQRIQGS